MGGCMTSGMVGDIVRRMAGCLLKQLSTLMSISMQTKLSLESTLCLRSTLFLHIMFTKNPKMGSRFWNNFAFLRFGFFCFYNEGSADASRLAWWATPVAAGRGSNQSIISIMFSAAADIIAIIIE